MLRERKEIKEKKKNSFEQEIFHLLYQTDTTIDLIIRKIYSVLAIDVYRQFKELLFLTD